MNKATIAGIVAVVASLIVPETALGFKLPGKKDPKPGQAEISVHLLNPGEWSVKN